MSESKPTPLRYAIGDLGPARRHIARLQDGTLKVSSMLLHEIALSMERCVERLEKLDAKGH